MYMRVHKCVFVGIYQKKADGQRFNIIILSMMVIWLSTAKGVLLVCDLTREKTFEAVKAWKKEIDEWARAERRGENDGEDKGIPVVLIANKVSIYDAPALLLFHIFVVCRQLTYMHIMQLQTMAIKCDMLTDPADSFLAGANMVAMCHEQHFASWYGFLRFLFLCA